MKRSAITIAILLSLSAALHSQDTPASTLHVYTNLIQIPVLTLIGSPKSVPKLKFAVSLDSGPPFDISHTRLEGSDPITLAILLDLSGDQSDLLPRLDEEIAALAPDYLRSRDHVSIYAVDCRLVQLADDVPADPVQLKRAVEAAIQSPQVHGPGTTRPTCGKSLQLWDALTHLTHRLSDSPGRRVILAFTDGHDNGSTHKWVELKNDANYSGIAIFGIASLQNNAPGSAFDYPGDEDKFGLLCQLSGGEIFQANKRTIDAQLKWFVDALRNRVIVEFPRPDTLTASPHSVFVTVANRDGFVFPARMVRPSGLSTPIADPAILADPSTLPSDPSHAPTVGKRGILVPPR
jgi:hypothetical protein